MESERRFPSEKGKRYFIYEIVYGFFLGKDSADKVSLVLRNHYKLLLCHKQVS